MDLEDENSGTTDKDIAYVCNRRSKMYLLQARLEQKM
jgi:hypothetical protein